MKVRLVIICGVLFATLVTSLVVSFIDEPSSIFWISSTSVLIIFTLALLNAWFKYVNDLYNSLSGEDRKGSFFDLKLIDMLHNNAQVIRKKMDLTASYIMQLGHPEQAQIMDEELRSDKIGEALIRVQIEMQSFKDKEERQTWIANGLAKFSEILRNKTELREYGFQIISNLVGYLEANQAVFYVAYESNYRYMDLIATYAYGDKKSTLSRIEEGQGVLGQNMIEKEFVFLTDIPNNYMKITSGLGNGQPRSVIIAPLVYKEEYHGVIEIASFKILEEYQIKFLERVCENIASEIAAIKMFESTQELLTESNQLAEELKHREEDMRMNIEELAATQEEMARKQNELNSYLSAIDNTIASVEFDVEGRFVTANEIFMKVMGYDREEIIGCDYSKFMVVDSSVNLMWDNLKNGKFFSGEFKLVNKEGKEIWLSGTFNPINRGEDEPDKIMMYAQFTTQEKEKVNDLNAMVNALKSTLPVVEFNVDFNFRTANSKFLKLFGFSRLTLRGKGIEDIIAPDYMDVFYKIKHEIISADFSTILLPIVRDKETVIYESTVSVAHDLQGEVSRVIMLLVREVKENVSVLAAV